MPDDVAALGPDHPTEQLRTHHQPTQEEMRQQLAEAALSRLAGKPVKAASDASPRRSMQAGQPPGRLMPHMLPDGGHNHNVNAQRLAVQNAQGPFVCTDVIDLTL